MPISMPFKITNQDDWILECLFFFFLVEVGEAGSFFIFNFFIVISPIQFLFYCTAWWPSYIYHVYILFSHIIRLHHKWLDVVLHATQQDLIANPFQMQYFASVNPKLLIHSTPSPSFIIKITEKQKSCKNIWSVFI